MLSVQCDAAMPTEIYVTLDCFQTTGSFQTYLSYGVKHCIVFSLEPLAQDPRESEITDMRYVTLFIPLPVYCSALTEV
jgi:hypothetical protein